MIKKKKKKYDVEKIPGEIICPNIHMAHDDSYKKYI